MVLGKTLESPLDCKEIQPVHSEGDQPWDFFGRNDAKAEILVLSPPHVKSSFIAGGNATWYSHLQAMVFPVVMYGCESWTVKKAECQRIDCF